MFFLLAKLAKLYDLKDLTCYISAYINTIVSGFDLAIMSKGIFVRVCEFWAVLRIIALTINAWHTFTIS